MPLTKQTNLKDKQLGDELFQGIASITRDAKSPYYSPYLQPTNGKAIEEMKKWALTRKGSTRDSSTGTHG